MGKVAVLRSYINPIGAVFEGNSIVGSIPPLASTTSWAHRFAPAYPRTVTSIVPAQGGTNYEQMLARLTNSGAWGAPVLQQVEDMLPNVQMVLFFVEMANMLIQHGYEEAWDLIINEYFPIVVALDPAKIKAIPVHLMHRDTSHLPDPPPGGPPPEPPYNTAPGWHTGVEVNGYNALLDEDPAVYDGSLRFAAEPWGALDQVWNVTIIYNGLPEGVHTDDPTYLLMLAMALTEANNQTSRARPTIVTYPLLTGVEQNGNTLSVAPGVWTHGGSAAPNYQWYRSGFKVAGQTGLTYNLGPQDVDEVIKCNEDRTNVGIRVYKQSNRTGPITSNYGPQKIVNGDFATDVSGWTAAGGAQVDWFGSSGLPPMVGGCMSIMKPTGQIQSRASQTFSTIAGSWYRVLVSYHESTTFDGKVLIQDVNSSTTLLVENLVSGAVNKYKFQAIGSTTYLDVRCGDVAADMSVGLFDDISVREIVV